MMAFFSRNKIGRKYEALKQDLKTQSNINSAMKQCNQMLEHKIQTLESEKTKLLVENKWFEDKVKILKTTHDQTHKLVKVKAILVKNIFDRFQRKNMNRCFGIWKGFSVERRHYEEIQMYASQFNKQAGIFTLFHGLQKPILRIQQTVFNCIERFQPQSAWPSISKETSMSLLENTEIEKFDDYFQEQEQMTHEHLEMM